MYVFCTWMINEYRINYSAYSQGVVRIQRAFHRCQVDRVEVAMKVIPVSGQQLHHHVQYPRFKFYFFILHILNHRQLYKTVFLIGIFVPLKIFQSARKVVLVLVKMNATPIHPILILLSKHSRKVEGTRKFPSKKTVLYFNLCFKKY